MRFLAKSAAEFRSWPVTVARLIGTVAGVQSEPFVAHFHDVRRKTTNSCMASSDNFVQFSASNLNVSTERKCRVEHVPFQFALP